MKKLVLLILFFASFNLESFCQTKANESVEERLVRVEESVKNFDKRVDGLQTEIRDLRLEIQNSRMENKNEIQNLRKEIKGEIQSLRTEMVTLFGVILAGMFTLFGFILWDRKSVTKPLAKDIKDVSEELYQLKSALKEFSRQEPKIFEALKKTGIL